MWFETKKEGEWFTYSLCVRETQIKTVKKKKLTRLYCSTRKQKLTSGSFKPLFGLTSSNRLKSFVIVCTCLYVEQLPKARTGT